AGTPIVTGLVDRRLSLPPKGATRCAPEVFRKCSDTWPASAASSAQSPTRPRCPQLRSPIMAMPAFRALATPSAPANSPTTCPKPRLPSTIAIVSLSNTTVGVWLARNQSSRIHSRYFPTRNTPCESGPTRLESPSRRATVCASASAQPAARMIAATSRVKLGASSDFIEIDRLVLSPSEKGEPLVDFRLGGGRGAFQEIEIA